MKHTFGAYKVGSILCLFAAISMADLTPNQIRKRYNIPPGEPIPDDIMERATGIPVKKKGIRELDNAASTVLLFFQHYYKGNARQAWKLLSPEAQDHTTYHDFRARCRAGASKLGAQEGLANVVAVIGQKHKRLIEIELSEEKVEKIMQWNRLNNSAIVYLNPQRPASDGEPQMFVVKPIDDELKITVLPKY